MHRETKVQHPNAFGIFLGTWQRHKKYYHNHIVKQAQTRGEHDNDYKFEKCKPRDNFDNRYQVLLKMGS